MKHLKYILIVIIFPAVFVNFNCDDCSDCKSHKNFSAEDLQIIYNGDANTTMSIMNYFVHDDSLVLRKTSSDISDFDDSILGLLIDRMYTTVRDPNHPGVGIAAPQIGINKRVIWVQRYDKSGFPFEVYLNAHISKMSDTIVAKNDGCLSIPGVSQASMRAIWVEVEYDKTDGTHHSEKITHQYTAHIFQHEIDHLDGIVFLDRPVI
jgi:peptide deformylase